MVLDLEKLQIYEEPIYREYIVLLSEDDFTIEEITKKIGKAKSIVFRQLKRLRDLDIVNKKGTCYVLNINYKSYLNNHIKYEIAIYEDKIKELKSSLL